MSAPILSSSIPCRMQAGFSLITASIIIACAALVFVSMLPGDNGASNQKSIDNVKKLERVEEAMRSFMAANGRLPCPADGQFAFNTAHYGIEAATPGTCTGGTPAAPLGPDVGTGNVVGGVIPTKTLGLPDDYAVDQFGHRFGYVVDKRATSNSICLATTTPGINIKSSTSGNLLAQVMHAFISYGKSGYGAYPANGSAAGPANRINSHSTDGDMQTNAGVDAHFPGASTFTYSTTNWTNTLVQKSMVAPTATDTGFDDMVWYRNDTKKTCCLGPLCGSCSTAALTSFSPSSMTSGQSLPAYAVSSGTCTGYTLTCTGGALSCSTGGATLTDCEYSSCSPSMWVVDKFNNRAQEFNSAGTWILEVPGGCANSAIPACAASTTNGHPDATVDLKVDSSGNIWTTDASGYRVEEFNSNGTYLMAVGTGYNGVGGSVGSSGFASGQLNAPYGSATDGSGNIWVTDSGNNRVQEYSAAGAWLKTFPGGCANSSSPACAASTTNGKFTSPYGIAIDGSNNLWVADDVNQRVEQLNSNGTFLMAIGTGYNGVGGSVGAAGYLNGQMDGPIGVAIDGSGNIWEVDATNNRVQEYSSAGAWLKTIPGGCANSAIPACTAVATAGHFNFPKRIGIDGTGNVWVGDGNNRVQEFNSSGTYLQTWPAACAGVACAAAYTNGSFDNPTGIGFR
jgi:sugar lactone lactonase YvrE